MLNKKQLEKYYEDGYVIPDFQMAEKELLEIEKLHDQLIKKYPKYLNYCPAILQYEESFLKYCLNEKILNLVEQLIGKDFALWNSSFFAKPALNGHATPWHQDGQYWPIRPLATCTVWLAIDDANVENGCLRLIPGTHKSRIDLHRHLVNAHEGGGYDIKETNEWMFCDHPQAIDLHVKAGQLVIGDARLLHATHPNRSTERRTVLLGWYYRKSNEAPEWWRGTIPNEIRRRDKNEPNVWDRTPGKYLR